MEELIFCQIECGLLAPGWCYDVKLESLAVVMMSVLHRFCTENANGPHADPYYSTISPILSCFAQHATAFIFYIESSEYERDRFLHKDHIIIIIIWPMAGVLKGVTLFNLNVLYDKLSQSYTESPRILQIWGLGKICLYV